MSRKTRQGSATIELAVCLPLLFLMVFGGIEAANGIFLKNHLTVAAYEAAKIATTVGKTVPEAKTRAEEILTQQGFNDIDVIVNPSTTAAMSSGSLVTVTITAPANLNSIGPTVIHSSTMKVKAVVAMQRN